MVVSDLFAVYKDCCELAAALVEHARCEEWDEFAEELPNYVVRTSGLHDVPWVALDGQQQVQLAKIIQEMKALQDELIQCSEARKGVLAGELSSFHNTEKLGKAYGS